jgi:hypothetical protein
MAGNEATTSAAPSQSSSAGNSVAQIKVGAALGLAGLSGVVLGAL